MDETLQFLTQYGSLVVFLVVLAKEVGLPVPATPLLVAAGALAGTGQLSLGLLIGLSVVAALLGDWLWYVLGRRHGRSVLSLLCRIALEPDSCVRRTENMFTKYGARSLVVAKFFPGLHTIAPPLAGVVGLSLPLFLLYDGLGALLWSGASVGGGYLFTEQLEAGLSYTASVTPMLVIGFIGALVGYVIYKAVYRRLLMRRVPRITATELATKLEAGEDLVLVDLRPPQTLATDPSIPGARPMSIEDVTGRHHELPRDRTIVFYCGCPEDASSVQATMVLRKKGFDRVWPLAGGIDAWRAHHAASVVVQKALAAH